MRTLVIGDIHGGYRSLVQALERANYDPASDRIITIGDVSDGWPDTKKVVDFLINDCNYEDDVHMIGNHDEWVAEWMKYGIVQPVWVHQGGQATLVSYITDEDERGLIPDSHRKFFRDQIPFYLDIDKDFVFVHAGWDNHNKRIEEVEVDSIMWWSRSFWANAIYYEKNYVPHKRVFIGHTTLGDSEPIKRAEVWNLDTGGGWEGRVTVMDVDTEEFWQSDNVNDLYPGIKGRR